MDASTASLRAQRRGQLKIFFGSAAGVGKTYAMLQAARAQQAAGVAVLAAGVETHGRPDLEALLAGLPGLPPRPGLGPADLDLDTVLARGPQLALLDDLARANPPGARHLQRYQDVLELLDAGIDVYTTLDVGQLKSRADTARQITGRAAADTAPDSLLEAADAVVLIDLPPEELLQRVAAGQVRPHRLDDPAAQDFFRLGNLTALREMALRATAERVDHQLQDYMHVKHIVGPWKSGERLVAAVSPSALSERLVRWTRRMAYNLGAPWLAVHVESGPLPAAEQARLTRNLALARELGGEVVTVPGPDVVQALLRAGRQHNATQIVVGKPERPRWQEWLRGGSLVDRLVRASGPIDVYVISGEADRGTPRLWRTGRPWRSSANQYLLALGAVAAAVGANLLLEPYIGYQSVALVLLFVVLALSLRVGRGPVLAAAVLSALSWNYLFISPLFTLLIHDVEDAMLFALYFVVALVAGTLTARLRAQEAASLLQAERAQALYALTRELTRRGSLDDIAQVTVRHVGRAFDAEAAIWLAGAGGRLAPAPHPASGFIPDETEAAAARWAFEHHQPAGRHTGTLPAARGQFRPMVTPGRTVGVLGLRRRAATPPAPEQENFLETILSQVALAVEHQQLDSAAKQAALLSESERLYKTLLNLVSHELRTPIAAIAGAASTLQDPTAQVNPAARTTLVDEIQVAAGRLNRLVENLLDMSRLETGRLRLRSDWCDVADLASVALNQVRPLLAGHDLKAEVAPDLPLVQMDFVLMEQALINLLHNAAAYTPPGTRVRLLARMREGQLELAVEDNGPGLPPEALEKVFDKFYRVPGSATGGTGLGLSITHGILEAHGGAAWAENCAGGGARFVLRLPVGTPPALPAETDHE